MDIRRSKIVCTIGPASGSREMIYSLIKSGMDVARLNFSHGSYEFYKGVINFIREASKKLKKPIAILQDLQGIKIRVGLITGGSVELKKGAEIFLHGGNGISSDKHIFISYPALRKDAKIGNRILFDDGLIQAYVTGKTKDGLRIKITEGGILKDKKGVNLPDMKTTISSFTEKDRNDLEFGLKMGVDYVALSFVRSAGDVRVVKEWLKKRHKALPLIAKIEKPEALDDIDDILYEVEGIMVARGDLGVEISPEEVPIIQKTLISKANANGKLVITATQMLESMTEHMRPTRAEAADVANAVLDGTDALMLSAETATGEYPLEAVTMMDHIIRRTEEQRYITSQYVRGKSFSEAVADAATRAAEDIEAKYIAAFTQSGFTAKLLSKFRPRVPIMAFTHSEDVRRRMSLYWGVTPEIMRPLKSTDAVFDEVERALLKNGVARPGDSVVITASTPILGAGKTNLMKLHKIGK